MEYLLLTKVQRNLTHELKPEKNGYKEFCDILSQMPTIFTFEGVELYLEYNPGKSFRLTDYNILQRNFLDGLENRNKYHTLNCPNPCKYRHTCKLSRYEFKPFTYYPPAPDHPKPKKRTPKQTRLF